MKNIIKNTYIREITFFCLQIIYFVYIELFNQYIASRTFNIFDYFTITSLLFNLCWITLLMLIIYILPSKVKRYFTLGINFLLLLFSVVNYFLHSYFNNIFSWKDLFLSNDGLSFVSSVYKYINIKLILFLAVSILFIVLIYKFSISYKFKIKKIKIIILIIIIVFIGFIYNYNKKSLTNIQDGWDSTSVLSNNANYYTNWLNSVNNLKISGTYEYIVRDLYFSFFKKDNVIEAKNNVKKYLDKHQIDKESEQNYYGIFKDKNLIFVMLESMDDWMINENATPTIYEMMHHGFNFTNHYSPGYVTGETANTEFIANTGMYPSINKLSPNYAYVNNDYPYSIANLFKGSGYIVNSFHRSYGFVYNRENMHLSLGYKKYHNYEMMGISDEFLDLDSKIIENGYDLIVSKEKFMSFIITYSPHSPYTYSKIECQPPYTESVGLVFTAKSRYTATKSHLVILNDFSISSV